MSLLSSCFCSNDVADVVLISTCMRASVCISGGLVGDGKRGRRGREVEVSGSRFGGGEGRASLVVIQRRKIGEN